MKTILPFSPSIWEAVAFGLVAVDSAGHVCFANALAADWLALTFAQLEGRQPLPAGWQLLDPHGNAVQLVQYALSTRPRRQLCDLHRSSDDHRWLEVTAVPLTSADTPAGSTLISLRDVTARHELLLQAQNNRYKFETILNAANEGIAVLDRGLCVLYVNRRICDLLGYTEDELLGKLAIDLYADAEDADQALNVAQRMWERLEAHRPSRDELWIPHKDGSRLWMLGSASPLYDRHGSVSGSIAMFTDLTEQKAMREVLDHLSLYDALTDIPNRRLFQDRLNQALLAAQRDRTRVALLVLDLDGFKQVNDSFGHACGDAVLRVTAERLASLVRHSDTLARLGGDEFAVLLRLGSGDDSDAALSIAHSMRELLREPIRVDDHLVDIDVSIGIAHYPTHAADADTLFRTADSAMFEAKRQRLGYMLYAPALQQPPPSDLTIARELRQALHRRQLEIVYQPEFDLRSGELLGVEALLRWRHPRRGLLLPEHFIPAAERTRAMAQVSRWVLRRVIRQMRTWSDAGQPLNVSVNLSAWDLHDASLATYIDRLLRESHVPPQRLTIEVTETALMTDAQRARHTLDALRQLGLTLSLDDFGTGYSSLSFITDLPTQQIKIDQSFVRKLPVDITTQVVVRTLIQLAHDLGRTIVAEGIECAEARTLLTQLGCDSGQGYLLAQPMPPNELERWRIRTRACRSAAR